MELNARDRYFLLGYKADLDSQRLQGEYKKFRKVWEGMNNVGELPGAILLSLAVKYPKLEKPVEEPAAEEPEEPKAPKKRTATRRTKAK